MKTDLHLTIMGQCAISCFKDYHHAKSKAKGSDYQYVDCLVCKFPMHNYLCHKY